MRARCAALAKREFRARPDHARQTHRRDTERRSVAAAEQLDLDRRVGAIVAGARDKLDGVERRAVGFYVEVEAHAAIGIFERETRNAPLGAQPQILDRRKGAPRPALAPRAAAGRHPHSELGITHAISEMTEGLSGQGERGTVRINEARLVRSVNDRTDFGDGDLVPWRPAR